MSHTRLFKAIETLIKVPKTICGTLARSNETIKLTSTYGDIRIVPDKGEHHWTHSSPLFQIQQLQNEVEKRKTDLPRNFTYRTLKATVHVTYRDTKEEENENTRSPKP